MRNRWVILISMMLGALLPMDAGAASDPPGAEANWHQWRGPFANGSGGATGLPTEFGPERNLKWKIEIPGRGMGTPVIWGDRIFVTTAMPTVPVEWPDVDYVAPGAFPPPIEIVEHSFELLCLDRATGQVLWRERVLTATPPEQHYWPYSSYANQSATTDGERVYAFFGSQGLHCYTVEGEHLWSRDFGIRMNTRFMFGEGSSPVLHGDRVIVSMDHMGEQGSQIFAVDKLTGEIEWRRAREETMGWATPVIVTPKEGAPRIVLSGDKTAMAYDLATGEPLWRSEGQIMNSVVTAAAGNGLIYVKSGGQRNMGLKAIRAGASGDLSAPGAVAWTMNRFRSGGPAPLLFGDMMFVASDTMGMVSCYNALTGEPHYEAVRLETPYEFKSSPIAVDGKIYLAAQHGDVVVLEAGAELKVLAVNPLDEMLIASPAAVTGSLFIRSESSLYCFGLDAPLPR